MFTELSDDQGLARGGAEIGAMKQGCGRAAPPEDRRGWQDAAPSGRSPHRCGPRTGEIGAAAYASFTLPALRQIATATALEPAYAVSFVN
jgi:hypothetical protein